MAAMRVARMVDWRVVQKAYPWAVTMAVRTAARMAVQMVGRRAALTAVKRVEKKVVMLV